MPRKKKKIVKHIINTDAQPFFPAGLERIDKHQGAGLLEWDPKKVKLYKLTEAKTRRINGHGLCKELASFLTLNANVLDYLMEHPDLIPEEWILERVAFLGTVYYDSASRLCVRFLYRDGYLYFDGNSCQSNHKWYSDYVWLEDDLFIDLFIDSVAIL